MRPDVKITDKYPFVARGIPDKLEAIHMNQLAAQLARGHPRIGQIDPQNGIILLHVRAEEQKPGIVEPKLEPR